MEMNITNMQVIDLLSSELSHDDRSMSAYRSTTKNAHSHFGLNFFKL